MKNRREFLQDCSSLVLAAALSPEVLLEETASPREIELEPFSFASFRRCLGSAFRVEEGDASWVELTLAGVDALSQSSSGPAGQSQLRGECFSLIFSGAEAPTLLQGTYTFDHPVLGRFAMLIVPMLWLDRNRACYQAVFNHAGPGSVEAPPNSPRAVHLQTRHVRQGLCPNRS